MLGLIGLACTLGLLSPAPSVYAQATVPTVTPSPEGAGVPPHPFEPGTLGQQAPLAGSDYPPSAGLSAAGAPRSSARPEGIDLDVLFIERTPKYGRYAVQYENGAPHLASGSETGQRWPAPGEVVTFTAHVMNKGTQYAGPFGVAWYIDGELVKTDVGPAMLWPHTRAVFELQWAWDHRLDGERLLDAHTVRFVVDGEQQIVETAEGNNELEDRTDALALELVVSPQAYAALNNEPLVGRTFSAEDWLQRHARALNQVLAGAIHPATPNGLGLRVRIDKIRIAWEQPVVDLGYDGGWFVNDDYRTSSIFYHAAEDLDWGMLHEWGHQLGLIDTYRYLAAADSVDVLRQDGSRFGAGYDFPGDGLMESVGNGQLDEFSAAALNATQGFRRGYYGEYQYDLAGAVILALTDAQGCPVPDAVITFYQRDPATGQADDSRRIDNQPEFSALTDGSGRLLLPNRPSGGPLATATGFTLHDNPFGQIEVVGSGNLGLLKVQKGGQEQFTWLTVAGLNLDYWRQGRPAVQQLDVAWSGNNDPANCPSPGTSTGTPTGTPSPEPVAAPGLPRAPESVVAEVSERTLVTLRWQDRSDTESEFVVWRSEDGGVTWPPVSSVAADGTTWTDQTASCDRRYHYRVASANGAGYAVGAEEPAVITALCESSAPGMIAAQVSGQSAGDGAFDLTWQDASLWEDGFRIEWAHDSAADGGWTQLAETPAGVTEYEVSGLECGSTYRLRVYAYNSAGASAASAELIYTTAACVIQFRKIYLPLMLRSN